LTEERQEELALYRQEAARRDQVKQINGLLVDGVKQIEEGNVKKQKAEVAAREPIMAMLGKGTGRKMVGMRRS
jgi:hypothetical protein